MSECEAPQGEQSSLLIPIGEAKVPRKRNYWSQTNWYNSSPAKRGRLQSSWTSSHEVPSNSDYAYFRLTEQVRVGGDPRYQLNKLQFLHTIGLITHGEKIHVINKQNHREKRKRLATLNKRYDTFYTDEAKKPKIKKERSPPPLITEREEEDSQEDIKALKCNVCKKGGSNILCNSCSSSFHVSCLRVCGSRAPDPVFIPFCPKCVGCRLPPKLHPFNQDDEEDTELLGNNNLPKRGGELAKIDISNSNSGPPKTYKNGEMPNITGTNFTSTIMPGGPKLPKCSPSETHSQNGRKGEYSNLKLVKPIPGTQQEHSGNFKYPMLPKEYRKTIGVSCRQPSMTKGFDHMSTSIQRPTTSAKASSIDSVVIKTEAKSTQRDLHAGKTVKMSGLGAICKSEEKGTQSKKTIAFSAKLNKIISRENGIEISTDKNKDVVIGKYQALTDVSSKLKSIKDETHWQLAVQNSILDEFNKKTICNISMLLQNLKTTLTACIELTSQTEDAVAPILARQN